MPSPNRTAAISTCVELDRKQSYNTIYLLSYVKTNIYKLTSEQKGIYDEIMHCVDNLVGEMYFLDAPGGTGKKRLIRFLLASVRSKNDIPLALLPSGIATMLLAGGRTAKYIYKKQKHNKRKKYYNTQGNKGNHRGVVNLEKLEKLRYFILRTVDRILMKFDI